MTALLYEIGLYLFFCVTFPRILYQRFVKGKYHGNLWSRLGVGFPIIEKKGRQLVWIHAVSLGETKAVAPLAKQLKEALDDPIIIISSVTETGHAEAKKAMLFADHYVYLPFDFIWIIRPIMLRVAPDLLILTETDFWLNFVQGAKDAGAKIVLVNGKLSIKSTRRFRRLAFLTKPLWKLIDIFCVQSETYKKRFEQIGVSAESLVVTGNIKFDADLILLKEDELTHWRQRLGILPQQPVLVIGSTHDSEEALFLKTLSQIWKVFPDLKVLLTPRHPERFDEVAKLCTLEKIPFSRYSQNSISEKLVLIDAMGMLKTCYQLADVAIVCGSFTPKVGGHNILEPCSYGIPVLFGPHMNAQPDLVTLVKEYRAGVQMTSENIIPTLSKLLADSHERIQLGQAGVKLMSDARGATARTLSTIKRL